MLFVELIIAPLQGLNFLGGSLPQGSCHHVVVKSPWAIDITFPSEHFDRTNSDKLFCSISIFLFLNIFKKATMYLFFINIFVNFASILQTLGYNYYNYFVMFLHLLVL